MNTGRAIAYDLESWLERVGIRRVVAPCVPGEVAPRRNARHLAWSRRHSHAHPPAELLLALGGSSLCGTAAGLVPVEPGTLLLLAPMEPHDFGYPPWAPDLDHLWIQMVPSRSFVYPAVIRRGQVRSLGPALVVESSAAGIDLFRVLDGLNGPSAPRPPAICRKTIVAAVTIMLSHLAAGGTAAAPVSAHRHAGRIEAICRHLDETAGRDASVRSLAGLARLSTFHFVRTFKQLTGQTVHDYINGARRARMRELRAGGAPFKAIAAELGFACQASFSRWRRTHPA